MPYRGAFEAATVPRQRLSLVLPLLALPGFVGLRRPDIDKRDALRWYTIEFLDADRLVIRPNTGPRPVL